MGWRYVQWSGMPVLPADKIRAALDKAGLKCIACHTTIESFEKDFDGQVAFWKTVGNKDVAPGGMMKDCTANLQAWLTGAKRLDELGAKLRGCRAAAVVPQSYHGVREVPGRSADEAPNPHGRDQARKSLRGVWTLPGRRRPALTCRPISAN